jgi:hypothetical protein
MKANDLGPVEVFAGSVLDAGIIQSLLEEAGIQAFIENEFMGNIAPWQVTAGGSGAAKIVVAGVDHDKALQIINDYGLNANE